MSISFLFIYFVYIAVIIIIACLRVTNYALEVFFCQPRELKAREDIIPQLMVAILELSRVCY